MNTDMKTLLSAVSDGLSAEDLIYASATSDIAAAIATKRIELDLTQKELANLLGKSQTIISKWENADCNFTIRTLSEIAQKLNLMLEVKLTPNIHASALDHSNNPKIIPFPGGYYSGGSSASTWTAQTMSPDTELMEM